MAKPISNPNLIAAAPYFRKSSQLLALDAANELRIPVHSPRISVPLEYVGQLFGTPFLQLLFWRMKTAYWLS
jgi:hypothetical protein